MSDDNTSSKKIIANLALFFEGDLKSRIDKAKQRASEVFNGSTEELDDHALQMAFILSQHYNIPLFSEYFMDRTFDELVFELELIQLLKKPEKPKMEEIVQDENNKEELAGLFDDWFQESVQKQASKQQPKNQKDTKSDKESEEESVKWVDVQNNMSEDEAMKMAEQHFFETGEFLPNTKDQGDNNDTEDNEKSK